MIPSAFCWNQDMDFPKEKEGEGTKTNWHKIKIAMSSWINRIDNICMGLGGGWHRGALYDVASQIGNLHDL